MKGNNFIKDMNDYHINLLKSQNEDLINKIKKFKEVIFNTLNVSVAYDEINERLCNKFDEYFENELKDDNISK